MIHICCLCVLTLASGFKEQAEAPGNSKAVASLKISSYHILAIILITMKFTVLYMFPFCLSITYHIKYLSLIFITKITWQCTTKNIMTLNTSSYPNKNIHNKVTTHSPYQSVITAFCNDGKILDTLPSLREAELINYMSDIMELT